MLLQVTQASCVMEGSGVWRAAGSVTKSLTVMIVQMKPTVSMSLVC